MNTQRITYQGRQYLIRSGHVFVRIGRVWSSGAVESATATAVLAAC